jgi:Uma2 family endonuclease
MPDLTDLTASSSNVAGSIVIPPSEPTTTTIFAAEKAARITINPEDGLEELTIPAAAYTFPGFRAWAASEVFPTRGRISYLPEGLTIDMSAELLETHNYVKTDVGFALTGLIREHKLGRYIGDRALFSNEMANVSTEPDGMFIRGQSIRSGRCKLIESRRPGVNIEVLGSPDWVLEVVSPTSVRKDKVILRDAYFRAGVGEYWIIDALGDEIELQILIPESEEYAPVEPKDGWLASPTFGSTFRLTVETDADGFAHYTLHIQGIS